MENEFMLSTIDNPFNPFEDFSSWFMFDVEHSYNTCGYLARVVNLQDDFTQKEIDEEIERAIDSIIMTDPIGMYMKVSKVATA